MNDELTAQLTSTWRIPPYAQTMLWLTGETVEPVQAEGEHGLFALDAPAPLLTLRWGGAEGSPLALLRWQADSLEWDGGVQSGGLVDTLHITAIPGAEYPIAVFSLGGRPLAPGVMPYPPAAARHRVPYVFPNFDEGLSEAEEAVTTWLAPDDSPLVALAQDALVSRLGVYCFGHLADEESGWHEYFALPILLEALTLFAP